MRQGRTGAILTDNKRDRSNVSCFVNWQDGWMAENCRRSGFPLKPESGFIGQQRVSLQHLDGDVAIQMRIASQVNFRKSTLADRSDDFEPAKLREFKIIRREVHATFPGF